mgnify:CR=1 FL=1
MSRAKSLVRGGYLFEYNGVLFKIEDRTLPTLEEFKNVEPILVKTKPFFEIVNGRQENEDDYKKTFGYYHFQDNCFYEKSLSEPKLRMLFEKLFFR